MEPVIYLDTHVVAWLYAGRLDLIPPTARQLLNSRRPLISPIIELELSYLFEIGRLREGPQAILPVLHSSLGLLVCGQPFAEIVKTALAQTWTRDPFDRIIAAQASLDDNLLLTKDQVITADYEHVVWE